MNSVEIPNVTDAADPNANSSWTFFVFEDICVTKNVPDSTRPIAKVVTP